MYILTDNDNKSTNELNKLIEEIRLSDPNEFMIPTSVFADILEAAKLSAIALTFCKMLIEDIRNNYSEHLSVSTKLEIDQIRTSIVNAKNSWAIEWN